MLAIQSVWSFTKKEQFFSRIACNRGSQPKPLAARSPQIIFLLPVPTRTHCGRSIVWNHLMWAIFICTVALFYSGCSEFYLLVKAYLESWILVRLYGDVAFMVVYCTVVVVSCLSSCGFMSLVIFAVLFISMTLSRNIYFEMVLIYLLYSLYYKCFVIVMLRHTKYYSYFNFFILNPILIFRFTFWSP